MTKKEFLLRLELGLSGFPKDEVAERLAFYSEMIDDRIEEGLSEEEAVDAVGDIDSIVDQIIADIPLSKLVKEKVSRKSFSAGEIVILVLGSPIWLTLLISVIAVILSLFVVLWSVVASFWVLFVSLAACGPIGLFVAAVAGFTVKGAFPTVVASIGMGLFCVGLSIFMFYVSKWLTKYSCVLTKRFVVWLKGFFIRKERG